MFSVQRKKEALGRGTLKLLPRNLMKSICEHVSFQAYVHHLPSIWREVEWDCVNLGWTEVEDLSLILLAIKCLFNYCVDLNG